MKRWIQPIVMVSLFIYCSWVFIDLLKQEKNANVMDILIKESISMVPALIISIFLFFISLVIRAHRWSALLGQPKTFWLSYRSISIGYLVQCPLSKLGEIARVGNFKKHNATPLPTLLSTIFFDRILDFIALLFLIVYCLYSNTELYEQHFPKFSSLIPKISLMLGLGLVAILTLLTQASKIETYVSNSSLIPQQLKHPIASFIDKTKEGFQHCKGLKGITYLVSSTIGIWFMYILIFYTVSYFYPGTPENFSLIDIWTLFFIATCGAMIPVPGAVAYPLFLQKGLIIIWPSMSQTDTVAFSTIMFLYNVWAINIFLGGISIFWQLTQQQLYRQAEYDRS